MRRIAALLRTSLGGWIDHRAGSQGAALAFYALFAMMPILVFAIVATGHLFGAAAAEGEVIAQVEGLIGRNGAQALQALLAGRARSRRRPYGGSGGEHPVAGGRHQHLRRAQRQPR